MTGVADIRAAVIGTGFIGTVHVEALRRIGVQVRGVLGSTAERGAARATQLGVAKAYPSFEALLADPEVDVVHVTSPNNLHVAQASAVLAAGKHVVCEKPLAMTAAESATLVEAAARSGRVNAVNFNIRFYPLNQHLREEVAAGALGDVRFVTGHYFQDWLLHDTDWNWRLEPDKGGSLRAVGDIGSHWLDLTSFITGQPVVAVMADLATFVGARQEPQGPVETFSTERAKDTVTRPMSTEDVATILLRFANGARGSLAVSQISAGRKNSLRYEIDGSEAAAALGLRATRGAVDRPSRPAERAAAAQSGPHGPGRQGRGGPARRPRRRVRRHLRCPVPGDLRRHRGRQAGRPPAVRHVRGRPRRDARQRRHRRERPARPLGRRRPHRRPCPVRRPGRTGGAPR